MNPNVEETTKAYELRNLTAEDMFPMFQILSKIGVKEFRSCFEAEDIKKVASEDGVDVQAVGLSVMLNIGGVILSNVGKCKEDIYQLLAQLSGMTKKEIAALPMNTFVEMVIDVFKKDEFKDFFQAVSKLLK